MDLDDEELKVTRMMNGADRNSKDRVKNDIEVNEYVRTKDGIIGIFDRYSSRKENSLYKSPFNCFIKIKNRKTPLQCCEDYIVKHSKQLIDLIEVKDVIKYRINNISTTLETKGYVEGIVNISDEEMLQKIKSDKNYHILEILTKESYMANCYKVGGKQWD